MKLSESRYPFWSFYPLRGITIEHEENEDPELIFNDSTLLSADEVKEFSRYCEGLDERDAENRRKLLHAQASMSNKDAFIAIGSFAFDEGAAKINDDRAAEIASALCVISLNYFSFQHSVILVGDLTGFPSTSILRLQRHGRGMSAHERYIASNGHLILNESGLIRCSRERLVELLTRPFVRGLYNVLLVPDSKPEQRFRERVRNAAFQLYKTHIALTPEVQTVGAVTTLEMLLGEKDDSESTSYAVIQSRLSSLIGAENYQRYCTTWETHKNGNFKNIFEVRHHSVHKGEQVWASSAYMAIGVAATVLPIYAAFSKIFESAEEFIIWIDLNRRIQTLPKKGPIVQAIEQVSINAPQNLFDWLPAHLMNYFSWRPWLLKQEHANIDAERSQYSEEVALYSLISDHSISKAFEILSERTIDTVPFKDAEECSEYLNRNSQITAKAQEQMDMLIEWKYYMFKFHGKVPDDRQP